jgi:hypothetical protein
MNQVMVQNLVIMVSRHDHQILDYMDQMMGQMN